ncbi:hypothetical protein JCM4814A_54000 [Streptomyces phaeofaciens JCM 4814]|uniref:Uncharacterized protein n=1 Tax=Streptomyces phaeofaciens TaxID=68254 RepID=A0A918HB29_9ACTN|nr:hypothetical protein [Streptomyces phaeofaciens]GGT46746.1 hypothetical protein GCM10010226_24390 [Streptomyces phaeofaciens]
MTLADGGKGAIVGAFVKLLPEWLQYTLLALVLLVVVVSWARSGRRTAAARRTGPSGAGGPRPPKRRGGAGFLGAHAPRREPDRTR